MSKKRKKKNKGKNKAANKNFRSAADVQQAVANRVKPGEFYPFQNSSIQGILDLPENRVRTSPLGEEGFKPAKHNTSFKKLVVKDKRRRKTVLRMLPKPEDKENQSLIHKIWEATADAGRWVKAKVRGFLERIQRWLHVLSPRALRDRLTTFLLWLAGIVEPRSELAG